MLACRLCRVPIAAPKGCAVCDPVRSNLVVAGEDEDERPSLAGTANEGVGLLRTMLSQVRKDLKANPTSDVQVKRALAINNTIAKVLETARKLVADGVSAVESMSFREQCELFVGWYANLAPVYRADVLAKFSSYEQEIAKPVTMAEQPHVEN